jgi:hypothetical protein
MELQKIAKLSVFQLAASIEIIREIDGRKEHD